MSNKKYIFILLLFTFWQILSLTDLWPHHKIPSPLEILLALRELFIFGLPAGSNLAAHCCYSLLRVMCGFLLAVVTAIPCGIVTGWSRTLREMLTPVIETIRPIPPLAWIPLAILWFGIGLKSAAFIIFLGCFFPIYLSTISGVLSVDRILIDAARTLGAKEKDIFLKVLIPAATPSIYTGVRIGMGIGWMTLVAAEFTGVKSGYGLGYMIMTARDIQRPDFVIAGMATIGLVGYLLDLLLRYMESRSLRWR
jgi:ABC-type nitrate/sulfonate/bicarbonate transport system permease component